MVLPILQSLGLDVLDQQPYAFVSDTEGQAWVYEFGVRLNSRDDACASRLVEAFKAIWMGSADVDPFNTLVVSTGLDWRRAALLRAYARYLKQAGPPYSPAQVVHVLEHHSRITQLIVQLFDALLDPASPHDVQPLALRARVQSEIEEVSGIDEDRILRAYLSLVMATVRTSFFRGTHPERASGVIVLKLDAASISELPEPRPLYETFVYGPTVEGTHLRFARGGIRWSDRHEDYRTEVLGLVRAQNAKNANIDPAGAKGVFIRKSGSALDSYRAFVGGLLAVTDNVLVATGEVIPAPGVIRRDLDDTYMVIAADRGTATFSDEANAIAQTESFWLGDAFASGGVTGYDHKAVAITARGAWESLKRHFQDLGVDPASDRFSVVGVGDMSGDVFGNGMLLSDHLELVAAFDHRHIFIDPDPDPGRSFLERRRLFSLPRSSWADYDTALISHGGGVWPRTSKAIPVSSRAAHRLGLPVGTSSMSSNELIRAILASPVDLLWNGGIGTYVKSRSETHLEVGDKTNDGVRIDAGMLRAQVVVEGGNLGVTPLGRIEFARGGGHLNSDAWDNSGGVDCSDREVNIKILLDSLVVASELSQSSRNDMLESMAPSVVDLVLADNRAQNDLLGVERYSSSSQLPVHGRIICDLESRSGLNRALEALPEDDELHARAAEMAGLTSPELATLAAHVKMNIKAQLLESSVLADGALKGRLLAYFPQELVRRFPHAVSDHPLRREILATVVTNEMVDNCGSSFAFRISEVTGASTADVVRAYCTAFDIFDARRLFDRVRSGEHVRHGDMLTIEVRRLLERATRWLLAQRPQPVNNVLEIARFRDRIAALKPVVSTLLEGNDARIVEKRVAELQSIGVSVKSASAAMLLLHQFCLLDVVDLAITSDRDCEVVAALYYKLNAHLEVDHLLSAVSALPRTGGPLMLAFSFEATSTGPSAHYVETCWPDSERVSPHTRRSTTGNMSIGPASGGHAYYSEKRHRFRHPRFRPSA